MSFSELRRRVLAALSAKNRAHLNVAITQRLSKRAFDFLDGSSITFEQKVKILKMSLLQIVKDNQIDASASLHLLEVVFDFLSTLNITNSSNESSSESEPDVRDLARRSSDTMTAPSTKPTKTVKQPKTSIKKNSTVTKPVQKVKEDTNLGTPTPMNEEVIETPSQEDTISEVPSTSHSSYTPDLVAPPLSVRQDDRKEDDSMAIEEQKKKKRKKRNRASSTLIGSVSPATPQNVKALRLTEDAHVDIVQGAKHTVNAYWSFIANLIKFETYRRWLEVAPKTLGLSCKREKIGKCSGCITALLTTPITDCEAVGCKDDSHEGGLYPHSPLTDFSSEDMHGCDVETVLMHFSRVIDGNELPSLLYVWLHDKNSGKPKTVGYVRSHLRKMVDFLLQT